MLDTLYKTDKAKRSQLLLNYRKGRLELIVHGIPVLAYAMMPYAVMAYIVTSLI